MRGGRLGYVMLDARPIITLIATSAHRSDVAASGVKKVRKLVQIMDNPRTILVPNFSDKEPPRT